MKRGMWNPCFTGSLLEQNVVSFQMSQEAVLGSVLFMILLLPENHTLFVPLGKCPRNDDYFIDMDILDLNIIANCPNSLLHFAWAFVSHVSKPSCRLSVLVVWETAGSTILMFSCSVEGAEARSFEGTCPKLYNKFKYIRSGFRLLILSSYAWSTLWIINVYNYIYWYAYHYFLESCIGVSYTKGPQIWKESGLFLTAEKPCWWTASVQRKAVHTESGERVSSLKFIANRPWKWVHRAFLSRLKNQMQWNVWHWWIGTPQIL